MSNFDILPVPLERERTSGRHRRLGRQRSNAPFAGTVTLSIFWLVLLAGAIAMLTNHH